MVSAEPVALAAVVVAAILTLALLWVEHPPVNTGTVLAAAPWVVAAGVLDAIVATGAYPAMLAPVLRLPVGLVTTFVVAGIVWVPLLQLATLRDFEPGSDRYLAAAGFGAAVVLLATLLVREGLDGRGLLWVSATPLLAALLAGVAYFLLGFVDATTLATTRWAGYFVLAGTTFVGTTRAVAIDVYGAPAGPLLEPLVRVAADLPTASASVGWPAVAIGIVVGWVVAAGIARVLRADETAGAASAVVVVAVTFAPGVAALLGTVLR